MFSHVGSTKNEKLQKIGSVDFQPMFKLSRPLRVSASPVAVNSKLCGIFWRYFSQTRLRLSGAPIETVDLVYDEFEAHNSNKSPLVFLHGLFGSKSNNRTVAKQLSERLDRNVYCLDLRNFGSSPHIKRLDYPSLAADVENWVAQRDFKQKPIFIGHSMGAKTAMAVALRKPDVPKMIVSVDNAPITFGNTDSKFNKYINQLRLSLEKYHYTNIKDVDAKLAEVEPNKVVRQFVLMNMKRGKKDEPVTSKIPLDIIGDAISKGFIASWPYSPTEVRWTGPALFIRGTESHYIPDDVFPEIAQFFPNFEIRDIKSGHWVISEKPNEFMDVLCEYIERIEDE
ncbi:Alpha/beta hydrolase family protein [Candida parapsilosis]|uniref:AB hydrolase-1 domain-containing protein n=2 Tax=Candida parapsilosis TaxID=5480 RepID=G8BF70_CANPC|nr:uncharacterized protein CPAR2_201460 [Candida parapsilosis]KAF6055345.1 Alpha/beta hydrolase family protein [Candida parapsilosis]KAF6055632.1 Alpha/beta hydrolase family protein [Candida parapsilosis]KAF6058562.1 Alpha/beta hydrolase family protein [Candida parapsilosis]KAF6067319.1 Alpha/beta hydrolase family protein [Candida parapsilosis]KAI5903976.1 alcohol acetyltransferase [Candida parapsilosis]